MCGTIIRKKSLFLHYTHSHDKLSPAHIFDSGSCCGTRNSLAVVRPQRKRFPLHDSRRRALEPD